MEVKWLVWTVSRPVGGALPEPKCCAFKERGKKRFDGVQSLRSSPPSEVSGQPQRRKEEEENNSAIFILLVIISSSFLLYISAAGRRHLSETDRQRRVQAAKCGKNTKAARKINGDVPSSVYATESCDEIAGWRRKTDPGFTETAWINPRAHSEATAAGSPPNKSVEAAQISGESDGGSPTEPSGRRGWTKTRERRRWLAHSRHVTQRYAHSKSDKLAR